MGWIKGLGAATTNLVAGKASTDAVEDPEYVKVGASWVTGPHARMGRGRPH